MNELWAAHRIKRKDCFHAFLRNSAINSAKLSEKNANTLKLENTSGELLKINQSLWITCYGNFNCSFREQFLNKFRPFNKAK